MAFAALLLSGCILTGTSQLPSSPVPPSSELQSPTPELVVKGGSYTAIGAYTSPAGPETIDVKLTVSKGLVSEVMVTPNATNPNSLRWETAFASGISKAVVGKKIFDLKVSKVSGSSLTGEGFNQALDTIRAKM